MVNVQSNTNMIWCHFENVYIKNPPFHHIFAVAHNNSFQIRACRAMFTV